MIYYEVKVAYQRQTGEDNPGKVKETYLIEGLTVTDVEARLMEEITPMIFGGECEVTGVRKVQYYEIFDDPNAEKWYKARVEMITIDGEKETRKAVSVLIAANDQLSASKTLRDKMSGEDCEVLSVGKTPMVDFLHCI